MYFIFKILISALIIAGVSEISKKSTLTASLLASLPLTSILAILWLYRDTADNSKIINLSYGIFWAVLPSLIFFIVFPLLLKSGMKFGLCLLLASLATILGYSMYVGLLKIFGIKL